MSETMSTPHKWATEIIRRTPEQVYELWIKALRSGEYAQKTGPWLRVGKKFDCFGVLCDLAAKDGGVQWDKNSYAGRCISLPQNIRDFMRLHDNVGSLTYMNDFCGANFSEIAASIEANYKTWLRAGEKA